MSDSNQTAALATAWATAEASSPVLQEQLDHYVAASRLIIPEVLDAYDRMVERILRGEAGRAAPNIGDMLPDALLPDDAGRLVALSALTEHRPLVVSFNRGHWCPYCRLELRALRRAAPLIEARGAGLISIVPEIGEFRAKMIAANELPFPVLSDIDLAYALELGLAVWIGEEMKALYSARGITLSQFQGNDAWLLPIPATFVVAKGGRITGRFVDPEFRRRMSIESVLTALASI
jgi:peroxiredoxin